MAFALHLTTYSVCNRLFDLFEPDTEAVIASYQKGEIAFPYWSQVWPAALGLAQFLLQQPQYVAGKKVLEMAAGLGLPSLVAANMNAAMVVASDYVPEAVVAMQQTFAHQQLTNATAQILDWTTLPDTLTTDVLLLSDVSYDESLFSLQEQVIRSFLQKGATVIISTPQRLVAKQAIAPLLIFGKAQEEIAVLHQQQEVTVSVFVLQS